jgi:hypothetical protein
MQAKINSLFLINLSGGRQYDETPWHQETGNMKFSKSDFHLMRWGIAAVCAAILLSSVFLYISNDYEKSANNELRAAQSKMNDARNRLAMALQDQENLSVYSQEYFALENDKIIGDDHRLDWIDSLEKLRNQNLVIDFRYNIAPQKIYVARPAIDSGNFDIHYSETKLQFDLLHEGQLLNFLEALRSQANGWYQLEGCTMNRADLNNEGMASAADPRINAVCSGGWITLKNRSVQP